MLRVALALFLALAARPALAQPKEFDFAPLEAMAKKEIDELKIPGAVVVVVQGDKVVFAKGFGVICAEGTEAVTPDHLFRVGSPTKMFTSAVVAKLAEAGSFKLDEPVGKLIDNTNEAFTALTPHQLLTGTAGLADFLTSITSQEDAALGLHIRSWGPNRVFTKPGDVFSYSNMSYALAGHVAERATKKPFADTMANELFVPLGMKRSTFRPLVAMTYPITQGHDVVGDKREVVRPVASNSTMWPALGLFTSGNDAARFVVTVLNGGKLDGKQVLPESVVKALITPHVKALDGKLSCGYGAYHQQLSGVNFVHHNGSTRGYGAHIMLAPEHNYGVVVLSNLNNGFMHRTVDQALKVGLRLRPDVAPPVQPKPKAAELQKFVGMYRNGSNTVELKFAGGALSLTEGIKADVAVTPLGGSRFRTGTGAAEEFFIATGKDGKTVYFYRATRAYKKDEAK